MTQGTKKTTYRGPKTVAQADRHLQQYRDGRDGDGFFEERERVANLMSRHGYTEEAERVRALIYLPGLPSW